MIVFFSLLTTTSWQKNISKREKLVSSFCIHGWGFLEMNWDFFLQHLLDNWQWCRQSRKKGEWSSNFHHTKWIRHKPGTRESLNFATSPEHMYHCNCLSFTPKWCETSKLSLTWRAERCNSESRTNIKDSWSMIFTLPHRRLQHGDILLSAKWDWTRVDLTHNHLLPLKTRQISSYCCPWTSFQKEFSEWNGMFNRNHHNALLKPKNTYWAHSFELFSVLLSGSSVIALLNTQHRLFISTCLLYNRSMSLLLPVLDWFLY